MIPNYVEIETSSLCNRRCRWCPNSVMMDRGEQCLLPWPLYERAVESLGSWEYSGWLALHNYNEPLANPRLLEELGYARRLLRNAKLAIYTNGDLLTERLFDDLASSGVAQIRITVYPDAEDEGECSHSALWSWMDRKSFMRKCGWDETRVRQGAALTSREGLEVLIISPCIDIYYDRGGLLPFLSIENRDKPCRLTSSSLSVDYLGNIKMCCNVLSGYPAHETYIMGNIRNDDLVAVWNSSQFEAMRRRHLKSDWSMSEICRSCRQEKSVV